MPSTAQTFYWGSSVIPSKKSVEVEWEVDAGQCFPSGIKSACYNIQIDILSTHHSRGFLWSGVRVSYAARGGVMSPLSGTQFLNFYFALLDYTDTLFPLHSPLFIVEDFVVTHLICLSYHSPLCFSSFSIHAFTGSLERTKKRL